MSSIPLSNEKISFTASMQEGWSGGQGSGDKSRAVKPDFPGLAREQKVLTTDEAFSKPLYLHPIETVNKTQKNQGPTTRGTMNNSSVVDNFGVSANYIQNEGGAEQSFFQNKEAKKEGSNWFVGDNTKWPAAGTVSFYAYAPYNDASFTLNDNNKTIHYTVPTNVEKQPDFIVANSEGKSFSSFSANTPVDLQFSHALTAITFSVSDDMEKGVINSIKIEGVKGEGDYDLSDNKWDLSNSTAAGPYTVSFAGDEGKVEGKRALTGVANDNKVLMMIPQELGDGAKVKINFTPAGGNATEASFPLGGTTWDPGSHITYVLSTTKLLNLNMGTITYPDGWQTVDKIKSSYTKDDAIGMYVVDKYNKVKEENLKFTYNDNDSKWTVEPGKEFKGSPQYNYFVYYPYQEGGLPGAPGNDAPNIDVTSADKFFADAITEWGKKFDTSSGQTIDQSDIEKMNSFDLQIGKADGLGESGTTINFASMTHTMALAEIKLGIKTLSGFTNYLPGYDATNSSNTYEWIVPVRARASSNIKGYNMYKTADYSYVSIVRPGNTTFNSVQEESDVNRWKQELSFENLASNTYASKEAESQQEGNPNKREPYTVALGDVYYSDGSISHYKDELLYGKIPVGIVVYIPAATGVDKWSERGSVIGNSNIGGHGLVMALKNVGSTGADTRTNYGNKYAWGFWGINNKTGYQSLTLSDHLDAKTTNRGSGYYLSNILGDGSAAVSAAKSYKPSYGTNSSVSLTNNATTKTTGWFLPSAGQIYAVINATCGGLSNVTKSVNWGTYLTIGSSKDVTEKINEFLFKAAGASSLDVASANYTYFSHQDGAHWIWSSSECNQERAVNVYLGYDGIGSVHFIHYYHRGLSFPVRPFLAF